MLYYAKAEAIFVVNCADYMAVKSISEMESFGNIDKKSIESMGKTQFFLPAFCVFLPKF